MQFTNKFLRNMKRRKDSTNHFKAEELGKYLRKNMAVESTKQAIAYLKKAHKIDLVSYSYDSKYRLRPVYYVL